MIPVYEPDLKGNEEKYLLEAFRSGWISSKGNFIDRFEIAFADFIGSKSQGITVSNGTVALHLALLGIGIKKGDEILVPNFTYIACANSVTYTNATPIFFGSNRFDLQPNLESAKKMLTEKTKAIILPHLYGAAADVVSFKKFVEDKNIYLIEDCAEAIGTIIDGKHAGSWGDISTFSFFGNKTLTTGEGGMVFSPHAEISDKIRKLKGQGLARQGAYFHDVIGYNYRMTNIQAAIGLAQTERAHSIINKKRANHVIYQESLAGNQDVDLLETTNGQSSYWMETLIFKNESLNLEKMIAGLKNAGIETRPGFTDMTSMPMYAKSRRDVSGAKNMGSSVLNLPSSPLLTENEILFICERIKGISK